MAPDVGIDFTYFTAPDGFVRGVAPSDKGNGPVWVSDVFTLPIPAASSAIGSDGDGGGDSEPPQEALFALFSQGGFDTNRRGLLRWNDSSASFYEVAHWPVVTLSSPTGTSSSSSSSSRSNSSVSVSGEQSLGARQDARVARATEAHNGNDLLPLGHAFVEASYVYFGNPWALVRVPADVASLPNASQYESYTPLLRGEVFKGPFSKLDVNRTTGRPQ